MKNQQTGNFNTNYIDPAQSAVHSVESGPAYDQKVTDAYYGEATKRLDPQWQHAQADAETQLANMGLSRGSEAWNREKARLDQGQADAYSSARNQAIMAGGAESTRQLQDQIAAGTFANTAGQVDYNNKIMSQNTQNSANVAQQNAAQGWQQFGTQEKIAADNLKASQQNQAAARADANAMAGMANDQFNRQFNANEEQRKLGNIENLALFGATYGDAYSRGVQTPGNPTFGSYGNGTYGNQNSTGTAQINANALQTGAQGSSDALGYLGGAFNNPAISGMVRGAIQPGAIPGANPLMSTSDYMQRGDN